MSPTWGPPASPTRKTPTTTSIQLHHSLDLELDRAPPTSCVCTHEYLLRIPGRWCGRWPYRILRTWCGPWPYRIHILKTSSRTSLRMNARACTPRAEFSDPESTALHSQKYRSSKFPDRQSIRKLHTTSLHRPAAPARPDPGTCYLPDRARSGIVVKDKRDKKDREAA